MWHIVILAILMLAASIVALLLKDEYVLRTTDRVALLRYQSVVRGLMVVLWVVAIGVGGLIVYKVFTEGGPNDPMRLPSLVILGVLTAAGAVPVLVTSRVVVIVTDAGVSKREWYGRWVVLDWGDINRVTNRVPKEDFLLEASGRSVSISHKMGGIDLFVAVCRVRLPWTVYGDEFEKPIDKDLRLM
jgi:hypothetical protein